MPPANEYVCNQCKEPVKKDATRCKHCGYNSGSHGMLYNTIALLMCWNPIGWAMAADEHSGSVATKK